MVNTRRMGKARSGSSALVAPVVASVGTQTEPTGREAAVQSWGYPKGRVSNGQGCTLCSLVEVLLQQVAELQEAVTRLKGVREAEGEQRCLLRDQTVPEPRVSTVAPAGKEAANPGSWEKCITDLLQLALCHSIIHQNVGRKGPFAQGGLTPTAGRRTRGDETKDPGAIYLEAAALHQNKRIGQSNIPRPGVSIAPNLRIHSAVKQKDKSTEDHKSFYS
ncbi:hypothetical protein AAES_58968 [Amazona aestiva]|uniref:Uncharacterized protein n=1 Tax=Amazona aestiva TaxID=12930 RepID=A0A0Q3MLR6_AMAAE|nr:hypothetical protein AAES_58968 [Amazona aestiva]